ncbi:hypothetical protein OIO90_001035 [Microbotryomycetes sp. JL221]|nr:hypothetical protein OIO90_001035 [Microbotryomycetes sp. JL221]
MFLHKLFHWHTDRTSSFDEQARLDAEERQRQAAAARALEEEQAFDNLVKDMRAFQQIGRRRDSQKQLVQT